MPRGDPEPLPPERFNEILRLRAPAFGLSPDSDWFPLSRYLAELDRWRRSMNLTGALSAESVVDHALESVIGQGLISHGERVIDIGTGAGFPGIPLAIQRPDLSVVLTEPRARRASFLRHVIRELGLSAVVEEKRAEEVGGQTFAFATVRAVGGLPAWLGASPLLEPGGALLAWTTLTLGGGLEKELSPFFRAEEALPIPESKHRQIVLFRRI
jgi:16S rRNA (guanine527-N7)-methyltransferase